LREVAKRFLDARSRGFGKNRIGGSGRESGIGGSEGGGGTKGTGEINYTHRRLFRTKPFDEKPLTKKKCPLARGGFKLTNKSREGAASLGGAR